MIAIENSSVVFQYSRWPTHSISRQKITVTDSHSSPLAAKATLGNCQNCDSVELSPEVQSLSKMVGVMEMLLPR